MSDWPIVQTYPLVTIHPWSLEAIGTDLTAQAKYLSAAASAVYPTAGLGLFIPFTLTQNIVIRQLFAYIGGVASSGVCVAVYDSCWNRICTSGSTATGTINAIQAFDITDVSTGPGNYYIAISASTATQSFFSCAMAANIFPALTGMFQQAAAYPLPSTATPVQIAGNYIPVIGLTTRQVL